MKQLCLIILLFIPGLSFAVAPTWQVIPEKSHVSFTAIQNDAPVTVIFKSFEADIKFDPESLSSSNVKITIEMKSVDAEYEDLVVTLKTPEWFDVEQFPHSIFESKQFNKIKGDQYSVDGTLTIRDKSLPVTLTFTLNEYTKTKAIVEGETVVKRLLFGVGQGEWSSTDEVADKVIINFKITATRPETNQKLK